MNGRPETKETARAIATVEDFNVKGTQIEHYAERSAVRELADRLMSLHPAAKEVGSAGMLAIAQMAILCGVNPIAAAGEIHVWYNQKRQQVQFNLGIAYYRRKSEETGGVFWDVQPRIMTDPERDEYGIAQGDIGAIAIGCRQVDMMRLLDAGMPARDIWRGIGTIGIGACARSARPKEGRPLSWTALKSAEKDLLSKLFPGVRVAKPASDAQVQLWMTQLEGAANGETMSAYESRRLMELEASHATHQADLASMNDDEKAAHEKQRARDNLALYGDPGFEGFDTPPQPRPRPQPEVDEETGEIIDTEDAEAPKTEYADADADAADFAAAITEACAAGLLVKANVATSGFFNSQNQVRDAIRIERGDPDFDFYSAPDADEAWDELLAIAISHAQKALGTK